MRNVALKLDKIIEMSTFLRTDIAVQEKYINDLEDKLSILNTLKEVNYYMGAELELKKVLQIIIDVVMGVLGVSVCSICLNNENVWEIKEHSILGKNFSIVNSDVIGKIEDELTIRNGEIVIPDLNTSNFLGLSEGSFIALSLMRGNVNYGIITIYYNSTGALNEGKKEFFRLMSTQLGIHLENAYLYEKIKMASICDGLTGLYNRLYLNEVLHKEENINISETSIIMIDIDNFKKVNDTYGHIFGDEVIKIFATILKKVEKENGVKAFRYGGEEFLVLCENVSLEALCNLAEEIKLSFANYEFKVDNVTKTHFTVSLGVCKFGYSSKVLDITRLIDIADEALYYSKKTGKNRFTLSSSELQLYLKSIEIINKIIARIKRFKSPFVLLKGRFDLRDGLTKTEYSEFTNDISKLFRFYDSIIFNNTGGFICILEDAVEIENIKNRLYESLKNYNYEYFDIDMLICENEEPDLLKFFKL